MSIFRWGAVVVCLLCCSCLSPELTEDEFGATKYGLPPVIHPGDYKTIDLVAGQATWVYMPVNAPNYYTVKQDSAINAKVSVYHQDKSTPILLDIDPAVLPQFQTSLAENVFLKVTSDVGGSFLLTCDPLVQTMLEPGDWVSDASYDDDHRYGFPVTAGAHYEVSLNTVWDGDGTKTYRGYIMLYSNNQDWSFGWVGDSFSIPQTVVAPQDGLLVLVIPGGYGGETYALKYELGQ